MKGHYLFVLIMFMTVHIKNYTGIIEEMCISCQIENQLFFVDSRRFLFIRACGSSVLFRHRLYKQVDLHPGIIRCPLIRNVYILTKLSCKEWFFRLPRNLNKFKYKVNVLLCSFRWGCFQKSQLFPSEWVVQKSYVGVFGTAISLGIEPVTSLEYSRSPGRVEKPPHWEWRLPITEETVFSRYSK